MSTSTTYPAPAKVPVPAAAHGDIVLVSRVVERHGYRIEVGADLGPSFTTVDLEHET